MYQTTRKSLLLALTVIACCSAQSISSTDRLETSPQTISSLLREQTTRQPAQQRVNTTTTELPLDSGVSSSVGTRVPSVALATTTPSNLNAQPITTTTPAAAVNKPTTTSQFQYMKPLSAVPRCSYNNQTYSIGQKWNDDCLQVCECVTADETQSLAISACRPRCPTYKDPPGANCTLQRSKLDQCCLEWICELDAKYAPSTTTTVMQTEGGQLNVSTTEIKMPLTRMIIQPDLIEQSSKLTTVAATTTTTTTAPTTVVNSEAPQSTTTTTTAAPTTTKPTSAALPTTTVRQSFTTNQQQDSPVQPRIMNNNSNKPTNNRQQQVPTTTLSSVTTTTVQPPPTTTSTPSRQQPQKPKNPSGPTNNAANSRAPKQVLSSGIERSQPQILATQSPSSLPPQRPQSLVTTISSQLDDGQQQPTSSSRASRLYPMATAPPQTTTELATNLEQPSDEVDPILMDLCIQGEDKGYKLNDAWQVEPCNKTCRCVFRNEPRDPMTDISFYQTLNLKSNSMETEIRCGLPPQCQSVLTKLVPSPECPQPRLFMPQQQHSFDKCVCPQVTCLQQNNFPTTTRQQQTSAATTTTTELPPTSCRSREHGRMLSIGETFNDECHSICRCSSDGKIHCEPLSCPNEPPADILCAEWTLEQNFKPNSKENKCCPQFVCKRQVFEETANKEKSNEISSTAPAAVSTTVPTITSAPKFCIIMGKRLEDGERVPEEIQPTSADKCLNSCHCTEGSIVCQPSCPPVGDQPPSDFDCPPNMAYVISDECCSRWACQIKETFELQDFTINPINSTNVEMSFILPLFAIGQRGNFKLNYTGYPINQLTAAQLNDQDESSAPPANARWQQRSNISTNDGIFSSQLIKYFQGQLKPSHKYWFKVFVHFDSQEAPFDGPIEGPLRSIIMPPASKQQEVVTESVESSASTTTPTTTTTTTVVSTTKVPTILLQPVISPSVKNVHPIASPPATTTTTPLPPTTLTAATTTTTTTTTTHAAPPQPPSSPSSPSQPQSTTQPTVVQEPSTLKPDITIMDNDPKQPINIKHIPPCQQLDQMEREPLPWADQIHSQMNGTVQKHAWWLLVALSVMTICFTIVSYLYFKKSRVIAPITSHQSAYDNPTFTKLVSYYANQPHVLLVDENNQNFNNDIILAKQKNLEVDKSSPLNHHHQNKNNNHHHHPAHLQHQINDIHHHNGRQHLI